MKKPHRGLPRWGYKSAMTYFPARQYHRRPGLNCCVRDGNRCGPRPIVTDKARSAVSSGADKSLRQRVRKSAVAVVLSYSSSAAPEAAADDGEFESIIRSGDRIAGSSHGPGALRNSERMVFESCCAGLVANNWPRATRRMVGAIKPSTVSTALLKTFLSLHMRPINLVVFQGSLTYASRPYLEGGFPLRCFQRLSLPYLATQRWS